MLLDCARNLRANQTKAETIFWSKVRAKRFLGLKFKRQERMSGYIVDFVCYEARLIIELDGSQHCNNMNDIVRTKELEDMGFLVKRYWNNQILQNIEDVLYDIQNTIQGPQNPLPTLSLQGEGL